MIQIIEDNGELLNKKQAAALCKVSTATIQRWMNLRQLSFIRIGKRVLFRKSQLLEDLKKFEVPAQN